VERAHLRAARTARKTPRSIPVRARRVNREAAPGRGPMRGPPSFSPPSGRVWRATWPRAPAPARPSRRR